jgi:predicted O-methyltransferase YrrM
MIHYGLLTAEDEWASEEEVYDLLYSLVRLFKPKVILETGCYKGTGARTMAAAARKNGLGTVHTCDTELERCQQCTELCQGLPVQVENITGLALALSLKNVNFAYIDSSGDRVAEIAALQLSPNAVVVLHDSNRPQYQVIQQLRSWQSIWHIPTIQ